MTYRHGLQKRVAVAFAVCVAGLSVVWGFAFYAAMKLSEDRVIANQLQRAAEEYPARPIGVRAYDEVSELPQSLRSWAETGPAAGLYEFTAEEFHVAVIQTDDGRPAFLVYDVAGIEAASAEDWGWLLVIAGLAGLLGALGFGLGVIVMRRVVAPVVELAEAVADIDPERLSADDRHRIDPDRFRDDEVGMLATTIEKSLNRISAFIERERDFTGSASHELRTPITVMTGALELLEQSDLPAAERKLVDRVKRAAFDMRNTIEMFLCLARENGGGLPQERFSVVNLVKQAIEQQRYLLNGRPLDVELECTDANPSGPTAGGNPQAFSVAVNNLVRNAFEHTPAAQGPIAIRIAHGQLSVTNPASPPNGSGLGLGIVQRLCDRNGWRFSLRADSGRVVAHLSW